MSPIRRTTESDSSKYMAFGKHHYAIISKDHNDQIFFEIGSTHHGVKFNATNVSGELDKVIDFLRKEYPGNKTD